MLFRSYWQSTAINALSLVGRPLSGSGGSLSSLNWDTVYAAYQANYSAFGSGSTPRTITFTYKYWYAYSDGTFALIENSSPIYTVRGSPSIQTFGSPSTTGAVTYGSLGPNSTNGWRVYGDTLNSGYAGSNSTGLGKTFGGGSYSGGTGYPASTTTYYNVAVTPGNTYSIVVPSNSSGTGLVQITYVK